MTYEDIPEKYRPEWPDGTEPSASEWAGWYASLPFKEQVQVAERILTRCFMNDHVGRIEELSSRLAAVESAADRYRGALIVIRNKTEDGLRS